MWDYMRMVDSCLKDIMGGGMLSVGATGYRLKPEGRCFFFLLGADFVPVPATMQRVGLQSSRLFLLCTANLSCIDTPGEGVVGREAMPAVMLPARLANQSPPPSQGTTPSGYSCGSGGSLHRLPSVWAGPHCQL